MKVQIIELENNLKSSGIGLLSGARDQPAVSIVAPVPCVCANRYGAIQPATGGRNKDSAVSRFDRSTFGRLGN